MRKTAIERFNEKWALNPETGCHEWTSSLNIGGYGMMWLGGNPRTGLAHRFIWKQKHGETGGLFVCHKCDNRRCVNTEHMFLGTCKDNSEDMVKKGRHPRNRSHSKLSEQSVTAIIALDGAAPSDDIAEMYGVSGSLIRRIWNKKAWVKQTVGRMRRSPACI